MIINTQTYVNGVFTNRQMKIDTTTTQTMRQQTTPTQTKPQTGGTIGGDIENKLKNLKLSRFSSSSTTKRQNIKFNI